MVSKKTKCKECKGKKTDLRNVYYFQLKQRVMFYRKCPNVFVDVQIPFHG